MKTLEEQPGRNPAQRIHTGTGMILLIDINNAIRVAFQTPVYDLWIFGFCF